MKYPKRDWKAGDLKDLNISKDSRATGRNKQSLFIIQVLCRDSSKGNVFRGIFLMDYQKPEPALSNSGLGWVSTWGLTYSGSAPREITPRFLSSRMQSFANTSVHIPAFPSRFSIGLWEVRTRGQTALEDSYKQQSARGGTATRVGNTNPTSAVSALVPRWRKKMQQGDLILSALSQKYSVGS